MPRLVVETPPSRLNPPLYQFQFINIVVNLLDALKTSFSHRSIAARSIGKRDSVSEAAVSGISVLKVGAREVPLVRFPLAVRSFPLFPRPSRLATERLRAVG